MNIKKTLSALMVGAMVLSAAPVLPASASFVSTAYAAKGGAKMSIPKSAPAPKAPQCYNGDSGKFEAIGTVTAISGVKVVCEKTSDGKNAQWMGVKK